MRMRWNPRICFSKKFPGDADTAGSETTFCLIQSYDLIIEEKNRNKSKSSVSSTIQVDTFQNKHHEVLKGREREQTS